MPSECLAASLFPKGSLQAWMEEQEADELFIKLENEVLVCALVFSYVRLLFGVPAFL